MQYNCYDNRELSWLKFNERVLEEAIDSSSPLLERLQFAAIFQSNLDEFFMIRVGSIYDTILVGKRETENKTGMTCRQQLDAIYKRTSELVPLKDNAYHEIMSGLAAYDIEHTSYKHLSKEETEYVNAYYAAEIKPLISPQVIDKRHPFPFLKNKDIYVVVRLESKSDVKLGIIPASGIFSRMVYIPNKRCRFLLAEELILHFVHESFGGYRILDKALMRITRNADLEAEEALFDHEVDFRDLMQELIKRRKKLSPIRLELSKQLDKAALDHLCKSLELKHEQVFVDKIPLDLSFVYAIRDRIKDLPELSFGRYEPQKSMYVIDSEPMIKQISRKDILLSYPFESIRPFIRLLNEAAEDRSVVSVKITLYRVAKNSQIVEALVKCAENGKDVLVCVELRARFDEENNIEWSKRLEDAGCTVIYGPEGLKVHSKLLLITRRNGSSIEYITQIGTGNYNEKTSSLYTDLSLMTANPEIGLEAGMVFNALSIGTLVENTRHLLVAPLGLQSSIIRFIDYEISAAKSGEDAYIGLKLNSLTDKVLIDKLIEASCAGVRIELVVRGICCLAAGVEGATDNITIVSIVGRYLEHSRIYIFGTPQRCHIFISSADFMTRNTLRRIEVAAPVYDPDIKTRLLKMFNVLTSDNVKARRQLPSGQYVRAASAGAESVNSQEYFAAQALENAQKAAVKPKETMLDRISSLMKKKIRLE